MRKTLTIVIATVAVLAVTGVAVASNATVRPAATYQEVHSPIVTVKYLQNAEDPVVTVSPGNASNGSADYLQPAINPQVQ